MRAFPNSSQQMRRVLESNENLLELPICPTFLGLETPSITVTCIILLDLVVGMSLFQSKTLNL
jgi:hypothetical protein